MSTTAYPKSSTKTAAPVDAVANVDSTDLAAVLAAAHHVFRTSPALDGSIYPDPNKKPTSPTKNTVHVAAGTPTLATAAAALPNVDITGMFRASPALEESLYPNPNNKPTSPTKNAIQATTIGLSGNQNFVLPVAHGITCWAT